MRKLIKNGGTEKDIRDWLSSNGYFGTSAKFAEVELHAIQRPGWHQVFRFTVSAKRDFEPPESHSDADGDHTDISVEESFSSSQSAPSFEKTESNPVSENPHSGNHIFGEPNPKVADWVELFGIVVDDERYRKTEIVVFTDLQSRGEELARRSTGLILNRRNRKHRNS